MSRYIIDEETITEIADAIRSKTGDDNPIPVSEMADEIANIRVSSTPVLEGLTVTPTGTEIVKTPDFGSDGFSIVVVDGDENLVPENILSGVTIYGVEGSAAADSGGTDTTDATATAADILEGASAYVNGRKITGTHVCPDEPILETLYVTPTGEDFIEEPGGEISGFDQVIVAGDENLISENIVAGVYIYGVGGTFALQSGVIITPTADGIDVPLGYGYSGFESVYVEGDSNLIPENIVNGVSIFNVQGTAISESDFEDSLQTKEVTPTYADIELTPDEGYRGFSSVTVQGDPELMPENIIEGVTIFGVEGSAVVNDESSAISGSACRMHIMAAMRLFFEETEETT